jgi:ankyrin repeat protein
MNNTPLMIACQLGHEDIAIDIAAHMDDICDFNFRNRAGFSALHYAYQSRSYRVADFLISRGALVDITDLVCRIVL